MLNYPKSTMRIWRMPMQLSSGHGTLIPGNFILSNFPPVGLRAPKFLVFFYIFLARSSRCVGRLA